MAKIIGQMLSYSHRDTKMSGHFAVDASQSGRRPGVLVVPDAFGLGKHALSCAERLAELGYAALAIDLWGDRLQLTAMPEVMGMIETVSGDRELWMGRVDAAREALSARVDVDANSLVAIGYCFGGTTVLEYARTGGRVRGVASFHGGLDQVGKEWTSAQTQAKLLVSTGFEDPMVPSSAVVALQAQLGGAGVDWEIDIFSGTKHGFTNPDIDRVGMPQALAYNAQSDRRSWDRLRGFLNEVFVQSSASEPRT